MAEDPVNEESKLITAGNESSSKSTIDYNRDNMILTYNQAIRRTIGGSEKRSQPLKNYLFQIVILFVAIFALNGPNFLILGLPFMKSAP